MYLLIKIHTQINGRVLFVGLLQKAKVCTLLDEPRGEFVKMSQNYIVTDHAGFIMNVSEGLFYELGLHSILFKHSDSSFTSMINIEKICPGIRDEDTEHAL